MWTDILKNDIGRTPGGGAEEFMAAVLKAVKVLPVAGALMAPTIPGSCC
jgi:hypothetical protein